MIYKRWNWVRNILEPGCEYYITYLNKNWKNNGAHQIVEYKGILCDVEEKHMIFENDKRVSYFNLITIDKVECHKKSQQTIIQN
jgi:hypothetical protein